MIYTANWGTHRFMFRVPKNAIDTELAKRCCVGDGVGLTISGQLAIFDLNSED